MNDLYVHDQASVSTAHDNPWAIRNPLDEARDLHRMVIHGSCTVESIRDLISVPTNIETSLLAYAAQYPKDGQRIHCVLQFRRKVATEFDRLVQDDLIEAPYATTEADDFTLEVEATREP